MSTREFNVDTAQRLLAVRQALEEGRLDVAPRLQPMAAQLLAAPMTAIGLVDARGLSAEVIAFARASAPALRLAMSLGAPPASRATPMVDVQAELFRLFAHLFVGLTGRAVIDVGEAGQLKDLLLHRLRHEAEEMERNTNAALEELSQFYRIHAMDAFKHAKSLGGMRLVSGGQRNFGPSTLTAVRITGLYADTQLVPDPIHPFIAGDLQLNALHLQLSIALHDVLQLAPMIEARLPVPPVFLFPSFEQRLEKGDAHTKRGIEDLVLRVVAPVCHGKLSSTEELFEYASKHGDEFMKAVLANRLFVPPGADPETVWSPHEAVKAYIGGLEGIRSEIAVNQLKKLPPSVALLVGISERLGPQYHLIENANEFGAQPLLSRAVDWHYFERCADASAQELRRKEVLSEQAFQTLRAVQDDSLSWLANIPVSSLADIIRNNEHRWFRDELDKYTAQLSSAKPSDLSQMVREVNHGLASLVQRQHQAMSDLEHKYAPKKQGVYFAAGGGIAVAATALMLPSLSPLLGVTAPASAALGALAAGAVGYAKEWFEKRAETRKAERSLLGMLAIAKPR